jgi:D-glycero-alpha-D-manno-heptose-7-phosphate kinase
VAYCGIPHESRDVNRQWVRRFLEGLDRDRWEAIAGLTREFGDAVRRRDFNTAGDLMNRETKIRLSMTPEVLEQTGTGLVGLADGKGCGARFTGAGGGGCIWAVGESGNLEELRGEWKRFLAGNPDAGILDTRIDPTGIQLQ